MLPLEVAGASSAEAIKIVEMVLGQVGLTEHKDKFPVQLSGGEVQRAAIARALVLSPEILLADEPTGNLDAATSWEIVKLLSDINKKGTTVVMATHNVDVIKSLGKRVIHIEKGKIVEEASSVKTSEGQREKKGSEKHKEENPPSHKATEDKEGETE